MNKIIGAPNAGYIAARNQHLSGFNGVLIQSNLLEYLKLISTLQTKTFPQGQCLKTFDPTILFKIRPYHYGIVLASDSGLT